MITIDENLLKELGIDSESDEERAKTFKAIQEKLEERVGSNLMDKMSDEQLERFTQFIDKEDTAGATQWFHTEFPNYEEIVNSEMDKLKEDIKTSGKSVLEV